MYLMFSGTYCDLLLRQMMSFKTFVECKNKQLGYGFGLNYFTPSLFFTQLRHCEARVHKKGAFTDEFILYIRLYHTSDF